MQCVQKKGRADQPVLACKSLQCEVATTHNLLRRFNGTVHSEPCVLPKCTINYISLQIDSLIISTPFPGKSIPAERRHAGEGDWTFSFATPGNLTQGPSLIMEDVVLVKLNEMITCLCNTKLTVALQEWFQTPSPPLVMIKKAFHNLTSLSGCNMMWWYCSGSWLLFRIQIWASLCVGFLLLNCDEHEPVILLFQWLRLWKCSHNLLFLFEMSIWEHLTATKATQQKITVPSGPL